MKWVFLGFLAAAVLWVVWTYNRLVTLKNQAENAWRQIDVQLKRRHDLIPNLVSAVKGYMQHEREVLERVTAARSRALEARGPGEAGAAEQAVSQSLGRLFALFEQYPDLKANENVLQLQEELTTTENRIGFARQFYNDVVMRFNTLQEVFPSRLLAKPFGFARAEYFELEELREREAPKVGLAGKNSQ
jgi:LemA protein